MNSIIPTIYNKLINLQETIPEDHKFNGQKVFEKKWDEAGNLIADSNIKARYNMIDKKLTIMRKSNNFGYMKHQDLYTTVTLEQADFSKNGFDIFSYKYYNYGLTNEKAILQVYGSVNWERESLSLPKGTIKIRSLDTIEDQIKEIINQKEKINILEPNGRPSFILPDSSTCYTILEQESRSHGGGTITTSRNTYQEELKVILDYLNTLSKI